MSKNTRNRILLTALAALLLVVVAVGSTVAYLQKSTSTITNTFKSSRIADLTLKEHEYDEATNALTSTEITSGGNTYHFYPGVTLPKDPTVTASADVDYYVFIKVKNTMPASGITMTLFYEDSTNGWTELTSVADPDNDTKVYYKAFDEDVNCSQKLIKDDKIVIAESFAMPTSDCVLEFTAYAIQQSGFTTPADAWAAFSSN